MSDIYDEAIDITEVIDKKAYLLSEASEFEMVEEESDIHEEKA